MKVAYFIIILFNSLVGWLSIGLIFRLIFFYILPKKQDYLSQMILAKALEEIDLQSLLEEKIQAIDLEEEMAPILDQRLEALVDQFRSQIPMAGMFLAGPFIERFKFKAKVEILKALPLLKLNLIQKVEREFDLKKILEEKSHLLDIKSLSAYLYKEWHRDILKMQGIGALLGLVLGALELVFLIRFF